MGLKHRQDDDDDDTSRSHQRDVKRRDTSRATRDASAADRTTNGEHCPDSTDYGEFDIYSRARKAESNASIDMTTLTRKHRWLCLDPKPSSSSTLGPAGSPDSWSSRAASGGSQSRPAAVGVSPTTALATGGRQPRAATVRAESKEMGAKGPEQVRERTPQGSPQRRKDIVTAALGRASNARLMGTCRR